jgi:nitrogen fixation-related uncharacterized protein
MTMISKKFCYRLNIEVAIGRGGIGFWQIESGQFDFLEEIGSGRVESIYMLYFF